MEKVEDLPFYEVAFDDGSVCTNLPPSDLLVSYNSTPPSCDAVGLSRLHCLPLQEHKASAGPPPVGTSIKVRWSDGEVYAARFVGHHKLPTYTVSPLPDSQEQ